MNTKWSRIFNSLHVHTEIYLDYPLFDQGPYKHIEYVGIFYTAR